MPQGERGVYNVTGGHMILTGGDLRLTTPQDVITATDSLEYYELERRAVARGKARATRGDRLIRAEVLQAFFREDAEGSLVASRIVADQAVCIQTADDVARGQHGDYNVDSGIATLRPLRPDLAGKEFPARRKCRGKPEHRGSAGCCRAGRGCRAW